MLHVHYVGASEAPRLGFPTDDQDPNQTDPEWITSVQGMVGAIRKRVRPQKKKRTACVVHCERPIQALVLGKLYRTIPNKPSRH